MKIEIFQIQLTKPDGTIELAPKSVATLYGDYKDAIKTATQIYKSEVALHDYPVREIFFTL